MKRIVALLLIVLIVSALTFCDAAKTKSRRGGVILSESRRGDARSGGVISSNPRKFRGVTTTMQSNNGIPGLVPPNLNPVAANPADPTQVPYIVPPETTPLEGN